MYPSKPRFLADVEALRSRMGEVHSEPHVASLNDWVQAESAKREVAIPWLDPGDAGVDARVLFLLESPGPMADGGKGSGLISVDNDDPTAANLWSLRKAAGLAGHVAIHWNAVPWYLGTAERPVVAPNDGDLKRALRLTKSLLRLLPNLEIVVPMGNFAKRAWGAYCEAEPNNLLTVPTWHPSARVMNDLVRRAEAQTALLKVSSLLKTVGQAGLEPATG